MEFELDFSQINLASDSDKITLSEIRSVFDNPNYRFYWLNNFPLKDNYNIVCGYSYKKRILLIASCIPDEKCILLQVEVADEEQITMYYCKS